MLLSSWMFSTMIFRHFSLPILPGEATCFWVEPPEAGLDAFGEVGVRSVAANRVRFAGDWCEGRERNWVFASQPPL